MTEEIDDLEFFQQDFTTASEWEIFTARLEEIFHEWKLPFVSAGEKLARNQLSLCDWTTCDEIISFADVDLQIMRYSAKLDSPESGEKSEKDRQCQAFVDLMSLENDFSILDDSAEEELHPVARWYGLRDFVVVRPTKKSITNESQIRILLSSVQIAVSESNCEVPVFVQVLEKSQRVFLGVCEFQSTRLSFDVVHLQTTPPPFKYLSGLLDMFKGKIGVQYEDPVSVSVRLNYSLTRFGSASYAVKWRSSFATSPFEFDEEDVDEEDLEKFTVLPFGVMCDPVSELVLHCLWPHVADNVVIDSQTYSDFDPLLAPKWSMRARFEPLPACFLSEILKEYLHLLESRTTLSDLLGDSFAGTATAFDTNPLDLLTEPKIPGLTSVLPTFSRRDTMKDSQKSHGPIRDDHLMKMLYYLFPDAQETAQHPYDVPESDVYDPMKIKSASPDSLVHRLSALLALCYEYFGGQKAVAHLWMEFAQEMRYRAERCIQIPGIGNGFPDSRTCLIHQKLQMLNICMERRRIREGGLPFAYTAVNPSGGNEGSGKKKIDDSEDEFFDCANDDEDDEQKNRHAPWNKPEGRLSRLDDMTLVDSDEPLYIPITQEPVPKTEDQLEDDAEVMLKLGPGSELGTQMMSASLLSDMESFKAANPNGKIEDFIRWYSPRDWIEDAADEDEETRKKGHLSSRMMIPGNTWRSVWESAKPVPARRQRRLFDDTKEAEKVLHFLESRNIGQIVDLTLATLFHAAMLKIQEEIHEDNFQIPSMTEQMERIVAHCCKLSRENLVGVRGKKWHNLLLELTNMEYFVIQARSLSMKVLGSEAKSIGSAERDLLGDLLKGHEGELRSGAKGEISKRLLGLFTEAKKAQNEQSSGDGDQVGDNLSLPSPTERQFTLRVTGKTLVKGMAGPQFLRAILGQNEFRLCGAFSQDTNFL
ncbi:rab3 GTPase-activating protein catalytic subunit [Phlebotomus argentipes]|uniref:rab3 GTPase-activating protein catalytic subunit n=1 Tax=Phlebotomus argentipes TaxID=94469 RepID=UPI0028935538|nr:rab3 GTPase-activating protein catalytic subunit [Phlebotomus argentipes]